MNIDASSLNPSVSAALAGWLALAADDRSTLARAIAALNGLGAGQGADAPAMPIEATTDVDPPFSIDTPSAIDLDLFRSRSYRALGPGPSMVFYCAGSRGLFELAQRLGASHYKLGWTRGACPETRIAHLRATAYGACWQNGGNLIRETGWDNWEATVLPAQARPAGSPVRCTGRAFAVDLPRGVDPPAVDAALMRAFAPKSLAGFADTDAGRVRCRAQGIDPAWLRRLTEQTTRRGVRLKTATEIVAFAPRQEADSLARLIEAVVAQAVAPLLRR